MGRPHLRVVRTADEEAHITPPSQADKQAARTNHATWRFDLLETVGADPLADPYCFTVVHAYSHFCRPNERTAYLSEIDIQIRTGGLQPRAIRAAKKTLVALGYMTPIGKSKAGIIIYRLANPRQDLVAEHRVLAAEKMKEDDAFQKEEERRRKKQRGCIFAPPETCTGGADVHPTGGADVHPNSLDTTLEDYLKENRGRPLADVCAYVRARLTIPDEGWPPLDPDDGDAA